MKKNNKKVSIAIANYNNEQYIEKLLDCLLEQSYKNLEIIVVNDGSPGNCDEIMEEYLAKDNRIKYVKHEKNKGLFQARLTGALAATGDYIAFLDADDYVSFDYFRSLVENATQNDSDIVIADVVLEYDSGKQEIFNLFKTNFKELNGEECLEEYFRQEGLNFSWHTGCNQLYSMKLWKKAEPHYSKITKRLLMTEDFAFSTVLFYYANKVTKIDYDCLFYCKHETTSTSIGDLKYQKEFNNINDLITSFGFIENFLKEEKVFDKYEQHFNNWKRLYANMHRGYIDNAKKISSSEKKELNNLMDSYSKNRDAVESGEIFSSITSKWNSKLDTVKRTIADEQYDVVSFDIFDTLVTRPFLKPLDLFKILDKEYRKIISSGVEFSEMREIAEAIARDNQYKEKSDLQDVTLDQIYETIHEIYDIDNKILNTLKNKECELEVRFCNRRNTAYDLYKLALECDKKVICTSDMYLPKDVIEKILKKNGYDEISEIYLSSDVRKMKATGDLFDYVLDKLNISSSQIIHIGDSKESDYSIPKSKGIDAIQFYKPIDVFLDSKITNSLGQMFNVSFPFWLDNKESSQFMGIRSFIAIVANKYFDNPYRYFNKKTDFNADPYLIGYYALGMYVFGISNWLLKNTSGKNDKISFMARDGYLVMEAYELLKDCYKNAPESEYMYVSRKALIPVMIESKLDFYRLSEIVDFTKHSPKTVLKYLDNVLLVDYSKVEKLCEENKIKYSKKFKSIKDFNLYIKLIVDNFYDEKNHMKNRDKLKDYFEKIIGDKPAVFDVGYSGRPEYYLSKLCNKSISTYFLNINGDRAMRYSNVGEFELQTFFDYKPAITGNAYELLISKLAPSCIKYDLEGKEVKPVFEEYNEKYSYAYIVETMQKAALEFVSDVKDIFKDDINLLFYQNAYIVMPILGYFNSSRRLDKEVLGAVLFEDDIKSDESRKMIDSMEEDAKDKNQVSLALLSTGIVLNFDGSPVKVGNLYYNPFVDLNQKGKISRLFYYIFYDRVTLKERAKNIIGKIFKR